MSDQLIERSSDHVPVLSLLKNLDVTIGGEDGEVMNDNGTGVELGETCFVQAKSTYHIRNGLYDLGTKNEASLVSNRKTAVDNEKV